MLGTALPLTPATSSGFCHAHSQVHTVSWCTNLNTRYAWMCAQMLCQGYFSGHKSKRPKLLKGSDVQCEPTRTCTHTCTQNHIVEKSLWTFLHRCFLSPREKNSRTVMTEVTVNMFPHKQWSASTQIECSRQLSFQAGVWKLSLNAFN